MSCPCFPYSQCCFLLSFCSCQIPISLQPCCMLEQTNIKFIIQKYSNSANVYIHFHLHFQWSHIPPKMGIPGRKIIDSQLVTGSRPTPWAIQAHQLYPFLGVPCSKGENNHKAPVRDPKTSCKPRLKDLTWPVKCWSRKGGWTNNRTWGDDMHIRHIKIHKKGFTYYGYIDWATIKGTL